MIFLQIFMSSPAARLVLISHERIRIEMLCEDYFFIWNRKKFHRLMLFIAEITRMQLNSVAINIINNVIKN